MLRQIMIPSKENSTVALPMEWYGREVEVIVFPLEVSPMPKAEKKLPHYIGINMQGFKFDREEANAR